MGFRLVLKSGFVLELERTFYIPSFTKTPIFVSRLIPYGFTFSFVGSTFILFKDSVLVGNGTLVDGLYRLSLDPTFDNNFLTMHKSVGTKRKRNFMDEKSSMFWDRRLEHFSIERIIRLVNDGVLETLDFSDFGICVDCIKGKQTNKTKKCARSLELLETVHADMRLFSNSVSKWSEILHHIHR